MDSKILSSKSSQLHSLDVSSYIPPALQTLNIVPTDCQLNAKYNNATNQTRFTFSVSWTKDYNLDGIQLTQVNSSQSSSFLDTKQSFVNDLMDKGTEKKDRVSLTDKVSCDGPCARSYLPEKLKSLGRCGHYLCDMCCDLVLNPDGSEGCSAFSCAYSHLYENLPESYARNEYEKYILARLKEKKRRAKVATACRKNLSGLADCSFNSSNKWAKQGTKNSSIGTSSGTDIVSLIITIITNPSVENSETDSVQHIRSNDCLFSDMTLASTHMEYPTSKVELLNIRLIVFEPGSHGSIRRYGNKYGFKFSGYYICIFRVHLSRELPAAITLKEALDELIEKRHKYACSPTGISHDCPARLYFYSRSHGKRLLQVPVHVLETALLWKFPACNSVLHFVLDMVGYMKQGRKNTYISIQSLI
uniref:RING-type domain-containing protein n=1 Tax=Heterorhabditis bacteriophora TaxID=37862 RepID=A0A1I7X7E8_HETBA